MKFSSTSLPLFQLEALAEESIIQKKEKAEKVYFYFTAQHF
jgi:hypothetical protein